MNIIWTTLVVISLIIATFTNPSGVLASITDGATSAVNLCVTLCATYAVWLSFINVATTSGLIEKLSRLLKFVIGKLFVGESVETMNLITTNIACNVIGVGNAATASGIQAIKSMDNGCSQASKSMIMLFILNATSLQLLPTTIISMRLASGSTDPTSIVLPTLITSLIITVVGVLLVMLLYKERKCST